MNYRILSVLFGLLFLPGCLYKKYRVKQLPPLTEQTAEFCETKEYVTVKAKKFTSQDSKDFFYGNSLSFYERGKKQSIVPIHLTVDNTRTSPIRYILCSKNCLLTDEEVAKLLHISPVGPIITTCVCVAAICSSLTLVWVGSHLWGPSTSMGDWIGVSALTGALIGLPIIYAHYRTKVNALIDEQLRLNRFPETQVLTENSFVSGLVYHKNHVDALQILVYEHDRLIATFDVPC